ncbi:MAG: hypothetical protein COB36_05990 [Alphaproteobacteria bacterium]|nr:MAG: hypothetical protein COB36_05990 [Alphaproteobacteria bacterium]
MLINMIKSGDAMAKLFKYTLCFMLAFAAFAPLSYAEPSETTKEKGQIHLEMVQQQSERMKKMKAERCKKRENATIGIKLIRTAGSFKELSDYVQKTKITIAEKGKSLGIDDLISRNENFSIRSANNYRSMGNQDKYTLNGNIGFETKMVDKAIELAESMSEMGYNTTYKHTMNQPRCY